MNQVRFYIILICNFQREVLLPLWVNQCGNQRLQPFLWGKNKGYSSFRKIGNIELTETSEKDLMKILLILVIKVTFGKGTCGKNLLMGKPYATDKELWNVLEQVNIASF